MTQTDLQEVAQKSLRTCYVDGKIVASPTHFSDFWARDTFWALPGVLAIGDGEVAKNCIEYFLSFQRSDGKIPRKISRDINVLKYVIGKSIPRSHPRPVYTALVRPFYSMDDNALLVRAAWIYFEVTKDEKSLRVWYPHLKRAMKWYDSLCFSWVFQKQIRFSRRWFAERSVCRSAGWDVAAFDGFCIARSHRNCRH